MKSERIKDGIKFQNALKDGKIGRPSISYEVISLVLDRLRYGESYRNIRQKITYKIKHGKIKHISVATICKIAHNNFA